LKLTVRHQRVAGRSRLMIYAISLRDSEGGRREKNHTIEISWGKHLYEWFDRCIIAADVRKSRSNMKSNNYIMFLLLLISGFSCVKPYGIQFKKVTYDFGEVEEGVEITYTYVFENIGTETVTIERVQPACACTITPGWDRMVAPGEKGKIPVIYKTPRLNGEITKVIFVKTNIPEQRSILLTLKGKVIIPIEIIPLNTWLGEVNEETKFLAGSFVIKNNTHTPLTIIEVVAPDIRITYELITIEEDKQYKLYYTVYPPFEGEDTVGKRFTLRTNNEKHQYVYPKFFYHIPPSFRELSNKG
jgi:hypothetical protein